MSRSVRSQAARLVDRALASRAPLDRALAAAQSPLQPRDRRLLQQLVHGTLRWLLRIDDVIVQAAHRPVAKIDRELLAPLRIAVYQLLFLDRVPSYAAVSEAVDEVRRRSPRAVKFANAVLRRISRSPRLEDWPVELEDPIERLAVSSSHPEFLVRRWVGRFGRNETERILDANNRQRPLHLLAFSSLGGRAALAEKLTREGVETRPLTLAQNGLEVASGEALATEAFAAGEFYVQDQASQLAATIPPPRAGERIFDAAAAPGGKSFSLLAHEPRARVVAADSTLGRAGLLRQNRRRLGLELPLLVADAAQPAFAGGFDRVVVDLPCSGTGILARHPELKWRLSDGEIGRLADRGLELVNGGATLVRPGGILVAITCSIEREENEEVAEAFLEGRAGWERVELEERLETPLVEAVAGPGLWRLLPSAENDGFSVQALLRR